MMQWWEVNLQLWNSLVKDIMILVVTGGRGKRFIPKLLGMMKGAHSVGNQPSKKPPQKWFFLRFFLGWLKSVSFIFRRG